MLEDDAERLTLFDLSWEDILFENFVIYLSLKDLFNLRVCSRVCKQFVDAEFHRRSVVDFAGNNSKNVGLAFKVLGDTCKKVQKLNLAKCSWLNDDLLINFLRNNRNLKYVNLNDCVHLSASSLQSIIIPSRCLEVLKLSKCHWLTTGAVDALTLHQNNLREFDLSYCTEIGERCLLIFFRKLNMLETLSLAYCQNVTDNVLCQISKFCVRLKHLNLRGCKVTDFGISNLSLGCSHLESLMVQNCPNISERSLKTLRNRICIDRPKTYVCVQPRHYFNFDFKIDNI